MIKKQFLALIKVFNKDICSGLLQTFTSIAFDVHMNSILKESLDRAQLTEKA